MSDALQLRIAPPVKGSEKRQTHPAVVRLWCKVSELTWLNIEKTWFGLCRENCVPNCRRSFAIDAKPCEFELAVPDPMHQFEPMSPPHRITRSNNARSRLV